MKSAYELAMERLEKKEPTKKLTEAQKAAIGEIDSVYRAKIAERETFLKDEINKAVTRQKFQEVDELKDQLQRELRRLNGEWEEKKKAIHEAAA